MGRDGLPRSRRRGSAVALTLALLLAGALTVSGAARAQAPAVRSPAAAAGTPTWESLTSMPPFNPGMMFLLTDGSVLVQDQGQDNGGTGNWWRLIPDSQGNYVDGTWSQAASLPSGYSPLYYASAMLPDGRFLIEGGEFNAGDVVETNQGAIYDPVANTWTPVAPPAGGSGGWGRIGDGPGVVLANGQFLLGASGYSDTVDQALFNPTDLSWTTTGAGKADGNGEEGFTLLPSGKVLAVDAQPGSCTTRNSEIYDPVAGTWASAGLTPQPLVECSEGEIGPQLLMYDGRVFAEGSTSATALYDTASGSWLPGPVFPVIDGAQFDAADAASALLPDGKVLLNASPGNYNQPTHFFLFDGTSLTQVDDNADASLEASNAGAMLVLPNGQVLVSDRLGPGSISVFSDGGAPNPAWAPRVGSVPTELAAGQTYTVSGTQLNGLSEGAAYGDDYNPASDYPLVQITNDSTGAVVYARTFGMSNRSIAPGAFSTASFAVPAGLDDGPAHLRVIANGIASSPVAVTVGGGTALPPPPTPVVAFGSKGIVGSGAQAAVNVVCRVAACRGSLTLTVTVVLHVKHGTTTLTKKQAVVLATGSFSLDPQESGLVSLHISAAGRRSLAKVGKQTLHGTLQLVVSGGATVTKAITVTT